MPRGKKEERRGNPNMCFLNSKRINSNFTEICNFFHIMPNASPGFHGKFRRFFSLKPTTEKWRKNE